MNVSAKNLNISLGLFIASFFLRFFLISKGPYNIDCLGLALQAEETLTTGKLQFLFGSGYPLTVILGAAFIWFIKNIGGTDPVIAVNLMSVFFSALCVPFVYLITKKLLQDSTAAIFSAIMFSLSPIFLGISVYGKSHAPSLFFLFLGLFYLCREYTLKNILFAAIAIGCMGAARLQDMILMIIPISFLFITTELKTNASSPQKWQNVLFKTFFFWSSAGMITLLFHFPFFINKETIAYKNQFSAFWIMGVFNNFKGIASQYLIKTLDYMLQNFTLAGLLISFFGLLFLIHKKLNVFIFCLLWIAVPILFYGNIVTIAPRFFALILAPLCISQGYLLSILLYRNKKINFFIPIIFGLIIFLSFTSIYPNLIFRHKHALMIEYAQWVKKNTESNARIIVPDGSMAIKHYANRKPMGRVLRDVIALKDHELQEYKQKLDQILEKGIPVYITFTGLYSYDYQKKFSEFMKKNYNMEYKGQSLYEDWHRGALKQIVFQNPLYKITKK